MLPTSTNAITTTTSTITPNGSRATVVPLRTARSMPNSDGSGIRFDVADTIDGLANTNFSSDSAAAKRHHRQLGAADAQGGQADDDAGRGGDQRREQQGDRERDVRRRTVDRAMPAMPPNAAWAREICPTMPVSTTSESAMRATARLVMTPKR